MNMIERYPEKWGVIVWPRSTYLLLALSFEIVYVLYLEITIKHSHTFTYLQEKVIRDIVAARLVFCKPAFESMREPRAPALGSLFGRWWCISTKAIDTPTYSDWNEWRIECYVGLMQSHKYYV